MLTHFHLIKKLIRVPVVVSEHWSAYRSNFGVIKELKRIKNIFRQDYVVLTVSKSLANDIRSFSDMPSLKNHIVPNVLNNFFLKEPTEGKTLHSNRFFMAGYWKSPKDPMVILKTLGQLKQTGEHFSLRIAGYGPQVELIKKMISENGLTHEVQFIGKIEINEVVNELQQTDWFLHASHYETFSVVCLEALSQGVPVIASNVGGIPEFVNETNGILVDENTEDQWLHALENRSKSNFDMKSVQEKIQKEYSPESVGLIYLQIIQSEIK